MSSGFAGSNSLEPPPLPPPDYTPISKEEWAKLRMPPLKGIIVDPEYPPTAEEAFQALKKHDRNFVDQPSPHKQQSKGEPGQSALAPAIERPGNTEQTSAIDLYRKSGTSDILGRSASTDEKINLMPGGTRHTAGGEKMQDVGVFEALKSVNFDDFSKVLQIPCFREAWLYSMIAGFSVGGALWTLGKRRSTILNGVMGSTILSSCVLWETCNYRARRSRTNLKLVKEAWEDKRQEKKVEWEAYKAKKQSALDPIKSQPLSTWSKIWSTSPIKPRGREG